MLTRDYLHLKMTVSQIQSKPLRMNNFMQSSQKTEHTFVNKNAVNDVDQTVEGSACNARA